MDLKKHSLIIVGILLLILVGAFLLVQNRTGQIGVSISSFDECVAQGNPVAESYPAQCRTEDGTVFTQDIGNEFEMQDMVVSENPRPNQTVSSPLSIKGRARGNYFFEASFPVTLVDENGEILSEGFVTADEEWMTEDFVPFTGELEFTPSGARGTLLLKRNNPSDLPENDAVLEIPVVFEG